MLSNDATIQNIKHEILYEVAKLAYAGRFEEEKDGTGIQDVSRS